jgi:hypothetical protein
MADIDITVDSLEAFQEQLEAVHQWCVDADAPCNVSASYAVVEGTGVLMYGCRKGSRSRPGLNALRTSFNIGDAVFGYSVIVAKRLLDVGVLIDHYTLAGHTHVVGIEHGVWAHNGLPVMNAYKFRGDDTDAMLAAIKFGGRLEKI